MRDVGSRKPKGEGVRYFGVSRVILVDFCRGSGLLWVGETRQ